MEGVNFMGAVSIMAFRLAMGFGAAGISDVDDAFAMACLAEEERGAAGSSTLGITLTPAFRPRMGR